MNTPDAQEVIREIAVLTATPEEIVSQMYAETVRVFCIDARILDYVPLLAARRVRETLQAVSKAGRKDSLSVAEQAPISRRGDRTVQ
ncbi:hypothetical protein AWB75_07040 [Caballeronia catudaia]|uniref:DUF3562 domain-containing protein n=1 Tax=Caballeronia catudaia TaxID=1777136 RepID=A0A158DQ46_9BURK|nr:DUF3562 domain-containing protein [Caballeronia catudaia]SAK96724.1 hypothetical protein AWB75_07040 [Caballeronia catudaia]